MLRSRRDLARIAAAGRTRSDRLMTVRYVPNELGSDRFAISTGRRLGGAVRRNRIRRRIREILRTTAAGSAGWDILIVARPPVAQVPFGELRAALTRHLDAVREAPRQETS